MNQLIQHIIVQDQDGQASAKNSSKLNKFLHSEVNQLIQQIIVQDQDGQNNNIKWFIYSTACSNIAYLFYDPAFISRRRISVYGARVGIFQEILYFV